MRQLNTYKILTYGCQMNELDSEVMAGILERRGLTQADSEHEADLVIFNTCSIRDQAERRAMGKFAMLRHTRGRDAVLGVAGCMANAKKETLLQKLPYVDFVLGTNNIHELDTLLDEIVASGGGKGVVRTDGKFHTEIDYAGARRENDHKAFVSIIRGCDKYCTYCVVPYTRGPEVSRRPQEILDECQMLVDKGYKEIMLLGQNVNSYGKDQPEWGCLFHDLLEKIDRIPGMGYVRFMTSHPIDITRELMEAVRDLKSLCEFVHFPLQAGSSRILKKMHRIYTIEHYLEKVALLRELVPNVALGTDIIVGFPTETEEDFAETYRLMKEIAFDEAFLFEYSPRKGTPAMRWKDDVPAEVKSERLQRLIKLQDEIYQRRREEMLGQVVEVLLDKPPERSPELLKGQTRCFKRVLVRAPAELKGTFQRVKVHSYSHKTLLGDLVENPNVSVAADEVNGGGVVDQQGERLQIQRKRDPLRVLG